MKRRSLTLAIFIIILCAANTCLAADNYNFKSGLPWDNLLDTVAGELTGPTAKAIVLILTSISGMMLAFGETSGMAKLGIQIVFGACIALNAGDYVNFIVSEFTADPSSITVPTVAAATEPNFISSMMAYLKATCMKGAYNIVPYALGLLGSFAVINIALTTALKINEQDHIKYIFSQTLKIGFFAFLVIQWVGGTFGIATVIGQGFESLGLIASGATMADPDQIVANGFSVIDKMLQDTFKLGFGSFALIIANIVVALGTLFCVFFMAIELFMCKVEITLIGVLTIPLIPFGMLKWTNFLFEKAIGAIFSIGIKLMVMSFVSAICAPVLTSIAESMKTQAGSEHKFTIVLSILLACLVLFMIVKRAPEMAQGLLSGSPSLHGNTATSTAWNWGVSKPLGGAKLAMGAAGLYSTATAMEGGRNENGRASLRGMAGNLAQMGISKLTNPYHSTMSEQIHRIGRGNQNNQDIAANKKGDLSRSIKPGSGAALKNRMFSDRNTDPGSSGD